MNEFLRRIIEDLRSFAGELLDPGLARMGGTGIAVPGGSVRALIQRAHQLARLVPRLIVELQQESDDFGDHWSREDGTMWSRDPADWVVREARLLPRRLWAPAASATFDTRLVGWVLHVLQVGAELVRAAEARLAKQVDEARQARQLDTSESVWADVDERVLHLRSNELAVARAALERCARSIVRHAGRSVAACSMPPARLPAAPVVREFVQAARELVDPQRRLSVVVTELLDGEPDAADIPTLYQRWCGIKLLEEMRGLGWHATGDPVGALFLAGRVELSGGTDRAELWVEPRIHERRNHPCGFRKESAGEVTPDFILIVAGLGGPDAFILDATRTRVEATLRSKGRYRLQLVGNAGTLIAGVPVVRRPVRSWAIAPITGRRCVLLDEPGRIGEGLSGVVPLDPAECHTGALRAWLRDVDRHARAHANAS